MLWAATILFYIVTAFKAPIGLTIITVILNITVEIFLLLLGFTDPGMIPKILSSYEHKRLRRLPIDERY